MPSRHRPRAARSRPPSDPGEHGRWSAFAGCHISGGASVHIHGDIPGSAVHGSARGRAATAYTVDLRRVLTTAGEVGLVIVPHGSGEPRAFVLAATPAVREWVEQGFRSDSPPWQVDEATPGDNPPSVHQ